MTQVAVATDGVVIAYLNGVDASFRARSMVPSEGEGRPDRFTHVVAAGGGGRRDRVINDGTVAVEAWALTYAAASELMRTVDGHMLNAPHVSTVIKRVNAFAAPSVLPVPDSPYFRLTATYEVTTRTTTA